MLRVHRRSEESTRCLTHFVSCVFVVVSLSSCQGDDKQGRRPIGGASASAGESESNAPEASDPKLPLAARKALDEGNTAYRAKQLDAALVKYREAAVAAPQHAAPWFGIYMAANEMKNTPLADSAMARVKALSDNPTALDAHTTVTSPTGGLDSSAGGMPAGHPPTKLAMPPGHPTGAAGDSVKRKRM